MNYPISSNTFANPLLVALLRELASCFNDAQKEFFVIGAAARDILRLYLEAEPSPRRTRDLDIAIAVDSWDDFYKLSTLLQQHGFRKDQTIGGILSRRTQSDTHPQLRPSVAY